MKKYKRIEKLEKAQEKIQEAIHLIRKATDNTCAQRGLEHYILGHLTNWAFGEGTMDTTIPKLIDQIEKDML
jgi:hypothetical protein